MIVLLALSVPAEWGISAGAGSFYGYGGQQKGPGHRARCTGSQTHPESSRGRAADLQARTAWRGVAWRGVAWSVAEQRVRQVRGEAGLRRA